MQRNRTICLWFPIFDRRCNTPGRFPPKLLLCAPKVYGNTAYGFCTGDYGHRHRMSDSRKRMGSSFPSHLDAKGEVVGMHRLLSVCDECYETRITRSGARPWTSPLRFSVKLSCLQNRRPRSLTKSSSRTSSTRSSALTVTGIPARPSAGLLLWYC